jgi:hypothetical protein
MKHIIIETTGGGPSGGCRVGVLVGVVWLVGGLNSGRPASQLLVQVTVNLQVAAT